MEKITPDKRLYQFLKSKKSKVAIFIFISSLIIGMFLFVNPKNTHEKNNRNTAFADVYDASGTWTLYARLLMETAEEESEEEDASGIVDSTIAGLMGSGGVTADLPYTKIISDGAKLDNPRAQRGSNASNRLAWILENMSYYNYFETVSGNKMMTGFSSLVSSIARFLGSAIGQLALSLNSIVKAFANFLSSFFLTFNIFNILGFTGGSDPADQSNDFAKAVISFLNNFGLNNSFFKTVTYFTLMIFCGIFGYKAMKSISGEGLKSRGFINSFKGLLIRFTVLFVAFPVMSSLTGGIIRELRTAQEDGELETSVVDRYLINVRYWASTQNLAPNGRGGDGNLLPSGFKDPSFDPNMRRDTIQSINSNSYNYYDGDLDRNSIARKLLSDWSENSNFNINTYTSDVAKVISSSPANSAVPANAVSFDNYWDLPTYIWSSNPNITDESTRLPDAEKVAKAKKNYGVANYGSFSTQSVALMLQTSFDNTGGNFYAYNIAPTGVQQSIKNVTSVKTEWKTISLAGAGTFGKFASFLEMVATLIVQIMLTLACALALFSSGLVESFKKMFIRVYQVMLFASPSASAGVFALQLGLLGTALLSLFLPNLAITLVTQTISSLTSIRDFEPLSKVWISILTSLLLLAFAYMMSFKEVKTYQQTPIKIIMNFPMELALGLDEKAKRYLGKQSENGTSAMGRENGADNMYYKSPGTKGTDGTDDTKGKHKDGVPHLNENLSTNKKSNANMYAKNNDKNAVSSKEALSQIMSKDGNGKDNQANNQENIDSNGNDINDVSNSDDINDVSKGDDINDVSNEVTDNNFKDNETPLDYQNAKQSYSDSINQDAQDVQNTDSIDDVDDSNQNNHTSGHTKATQQNPTLDDTQFENGSFNSFRSQLLASPESEAKVLENKKAQKELIKAGFTKKDKNGKTVADIKNATANLEQGRKSNSAQLYRNRANKVQNALNVGAKDLYKQSQKPVKTEKVKNTSKTVAKKVVKTNVNTSKAIARTTETFVRKNSDIPVDKIKKISGNVVTQVKKTPQTLKNIDRKVTAKGDAHKKKVANKKNLKENNNKKFIDNFQNK